MPIFWPYLPWGLGGPEPLGVSEQNEAGDQVWKPLLQCGIVGGTDDK